MSQKAFTIPGPVGINTDTPSTVFEVVADSTSPDAVVRIRDTQANTAFNGSGSGLELIVGEANTTNKFTPAIKFGSNDSAFTTTTPKFGAAITAAVAQTYESDTNGGMDLGIWTAPTNPGTGSGLVERINVKANGQVSIGGITNFGGTLEVFSTGLGTPSSWVSMTRGSNDAAGPYFALVKSRSTDPASRTTVQLGDDLGSVVFQGTNGTTNLIGAAIKSTASAAPTSTNVQADLIFSTTSSTDTINSSEKMRITSGGNVGIGISLPSAKVEINNTTAGYGSLQLKISNLGGNDVDDSRITLNNGTIASALVLRSNTHATEPNALVLSASGANSLLFYTNGSERVRITSTGAIALSGAANTGTAGQALLSNGSASAAAWGNVSASALSGQVPSANGGTGLNITGSGVVVYTTGTGALTATTGTGNVVMSASPALTGIVRIGNGTANLSSPDPFPLQVQGLAGSIGGAVLSRHSADASPPVLAFAKSRATTSTPGTAVLSGDTLGQIIAVGDDATGSFSQAASAISMSAAQTWTSTAHGSDIVFSVTPNGTTARTTAVKIQNDIGVQFYGNVGIGVAPATTARLYVSESGSNATATATLSTVNQTNTTLTAARTVYGSNNTASSTLLNSTVYTPTIIGSANTATWTGGSNTYVGNVYGVQGIALANGSDATYKQISSLYAFSGTSTISGTSLISEAGGAKNSISIGATSTVTSAYGVYSSVLATTNGTATSAYGVYSSVSNQASSTITNAYSFYGTTSGFGGTATNRYGLYLTSNVGNSFIGGGLTVGGTAPTGTGTLGLGVGVTPPGTDGALSVKESISTTTTGAVGTTRLSINSPSGQTADIVQIMKNSTVLTRVDASGKILANLATATGDAVLQVSNGVYFGATLSSDSNTLDYYQEGTWTPTIVGTTTAGTGTYSSQYGTYTRIGNRVFISGIIQLTAHTGTGFIRITGLPFTSNSYAHPVSIMVQNLTFSGGLAAYVASSSSNIDIVNQVSGGGFAFINMDTSFNVWINGSYLVA